MKKWLLNKSWHFAVITTILWTILTFVSFYFSSRSYSLMPFLLVLLFIYPISTFTACFIFSKIFAKILTLQIPMTLICLIEYFVLGFDEIGSPNFLIMSLIMIILGSLIGRCFSSVPYETISDKIKIRKQKKEQAEKEYKSIIDHK